jgi:predicted Zn finger-like uncharacterized protein
VSLICPKCEMEVEFDDDGLPEKRRPVRCGSCGESWFTGGKTDLYALSFAKPSEIDPEVARVLKEEAEREMAARKVESEEQLVEELGQSTKKRSQASGEETTPSSQDGYASLTWRQRGFVVVLFLSVGFIVLYVYAPSLAKTFPLLADWIFSYVFLVNDVRQVLSEIIHSWDQFLIELDIVGTAAKTKDWFVGTVQAIIDFGLNLVGSQEAAARD